METVAPIEVLEGETLSVSVPVRHEEGGVIRVRQTRIPLERVIQAYISGQAPEQIVEDFDTLDLGDVYLIIGFYLHHREAVDQYVQRANAQFEAARLEARVRLEANGKLERLREILDRNQA